MNLSFPGAARLPDGTGRPRLQYGDVLFFLIDFILCLFAAFFMVKRVGHGIDFSDESWYVADPFIVAQGRIPYVNDLSAAPGFTIPLALCFRAYMSLRGTEGIFMFSRYLYLIWMFSVGALTVLLIRKEIDSRVPVIAWLPILLTLNFLFDISYNTIGVVYLPLILTLVYAAWDKPAPRAFRFGLAAGVLAARAVIGSPFLMVPGFLTLLFLALKKKKPLLRGLLLGVGFSALLVVGWCCLRGGAERLLYGLYAMIEDYDYFKYERKVGLGDTLHMIWRYSVPAVRFTALAVGARLLLRRREQLLRTVLWVLALGFMLYGLYTGLRWVRLMILNCWFEFIILPLLPGERKKHLGLCGVAMLYYLLFVTSSLGNIWGAEGREYWLIVPSILSCLALYYAIPGRFAARSVFTVLISAFFLIQCRYCWNNIYRDAPVAEHTATVPSGIWKGCRTTEQRARDVVALEACIREFTEPEDKVLFRDWVSYGYLMSDGKACTTSPLVSCNSNYNSPRFLFDLFYTDKAVPDKIIYIGTVGGTTTADDPDCGFNPFLNDYYIETRRGEAGQFTVRVFELHHGADALAYASANASRLPWRE